MMYSSLGTKDIVHRATAAYPSDRDIDRDLDKYRDWGRHRDRDGHKDRDWDGHKDRDWDRHKDRNRYGHGDEDKDRGHIRDDHKHRLLQRPRTASTIRRDPPSSRPITWQQHQQPPQQQQQIPDSPALVIHRKSEGAAPAAAPAIAKTATKASNQLASTAMLALDTIPAKWTLLHDQTLKTLVTMARADITEACKFSPHAADPVGARPRQPLTELERMLAGLCTQVQGNCTQESTQGQALYSLATTASSTKQELANAARSFLVKGDALLAAVHQKANRATETNLLAALNALKAVMEAHQTQANAKAMWIKDVRECVEQSLTALLQRLNDIAIVGVVNEVVKVKQIHVEYMRRLEAHFRPDRGDVSTAVAPIVASDALLNDYSQFLEHVIRTYPNLAPLAAATKAVLLDQYKASDALTPQRKQLLFETLMTDVQNYIDAQAAIEDSTQVSQQITTLQHEYARARAIASEANDRLLQAWTRDTGNWALIDMLHAEQQRAANTLDAVRRQLADMRAPGPVTPIVNAAVSLPELSKAHYTRFYSKVAGPASATTDNTAVGGTMLIPAVLYHRFQDIILSSTTDTIELLKTNGLRDIETAAGHAQSAYAERMAELRTIRTDLDSYVQANVQAVYNTVTDTKQRLVRVYNIASPEFIELEKIVDSHNLLVYDMVLAEQNYESLIAAASIYALQLQLI